MFIGVVSLGVGLYGNEEVSSGSRSLLVSVRQLGHRVLAAKAKMETSPRDAKDREDANTYINSIIDKLDGYVVVNERIGIRWVYKFDCLLFFHSLIL